MKKIVVWAFIGVFSHTLVGQKLPIKRPNIIFIMSDDHAYQAISAYDQRLLSTPNIDRIAKKGMIFMDHYAQASCTAGRAAFITGQYPIRSGMVTVGQPGDLLGLLHRYARVVAAVDDEQRHLDAVGVVQRGDAFVEGAHARLALVAVFGPAQVAAIALGVGQEGREAGNVGVFRPNGTAHTMLINRIIASVKPEDILWEAPQKNQQVWFIKLFGAEVNLGNIAPNDMIPLECLRLGLRGDTFFDFLPKSYADRLKQVNDEEDEIDEDDN